MSLHLIFFGKSNWSQDIERDYLKRLSFKVEIIQWKSKGPEQDYQLLRKNVKSAEIHLLDEKGVLVDTYQFKEIISHLLVRNSYLVVGGVDGHAPQLKREAKSLISLSKLTLPYYLARLVLIEQLYRVDSIGRSSYHRA